MREMSKITHRMVRFVDSTRIEESVGSPFFLHAMGVHILLIWSGAYFVLGPLALIAILVGPLYLMLGIEWSVDHMMERIGEEEAK